MSVIDDIKTQLAAASPAKKFLFYIALPVLLLFVMFGAGKDILASFLEKEKEKSVDGQDKKIEADTAAVAAQATAAEGQVANLEKEKEDAVQQVQSEDQADLINARYPNDGK